MATTVNQKPKINPALKGLLPPLSQEEYNELENSIKKEGCRDPILIWSGPDEIIDGHNRFEICEKLGVKYDMKFKKFENQEAVEDWMASNQIARRNLTAQQRLYYLGKEYRRKVTNQGGDTSSPDRPNVAAELAKERGVSERTMVEAGRFASAVDTLTEAKPEAREAILAGTTKATVDDVIQLAKLPDNLLKAAAESFAQGVKIKEIKEKIPKPAPKPGMIQAFAEDKKIEDALGVIIRLTLARQQILGVTAESQACENALKILEASWRQWRTLSS